MALTGGPRRTDKGSDSEAKELVDAGRAVKDLVSPRVVKRALAPHAPPVRRPIRFDFNHKLNEERRRKDHHTEIASQK
ncbi:hypothetical protein E4U36_004284 [Claviceps purpurea]|nr:hypothetical protein E4U36_004284 [Claviceps purpurea]